MAAVAQNVKTQKNCGGLPSKYIWRKETYTWIKTVCAVLEYYFIKLGQDRARSQSVLWWWSELLSCKHTDLSLKGESVAVCLCLCSTSICKQPNGHNFSSHRLKYAKASTHTPNTHSRTVYSPFALKCKRLLKISWEQEHDAVHHIKSLYAWLIID